VYYFLTLELLFELFFYYGLYRIRNNFWQWQIIIPGVNCHGN
jgi:hypothetical protein